MFKREIAVSGRFDSIDVKLHIPDLHVIGDGGGEPEQLALFGHARCEAGLERDRRRHSFRVEGQETHDVHAGGTVGHIGQPVVERQRAGHTGSGEDA